MTFNYCQKQFQDISITTAMENVSHVYIYFLPDCFLPINTINGAKFLKIQHFSFFNVLNLYRHSVGILYQDQLIFKYAICARLTLKTFFCFLSKLCNMALLFKN